MFKRLPDDGTVVLRNRGVYSIVDLYYNTTTGALCAEISPHKFIILKEDMTTTKGGVNFEHLQTDVKIYRNNFGRIFITDDGDRKPLAVEAAIKLLGGGSDT